MDTPRILAINDVHLQAEQNDSAAVVAFYTELIGFKCLDPESEEQLITFRGFPRSSPRLIVDLTCQPPGPARRRQVLIQIASLTACAELMVESDIPFFWSRGWSFYDRRLIMLDPAGNQVDLVAYHPL